MGGGHIWLTGETEIKHFVQGLGPLTCNLLGLCLISATIRRLLARIATVGWGRAAALGGHECLGVARHSKLNLALRAAGRGS